MTHFHRAIDDTRIDDLLASYRQIAEDNQAGMSSCAYVPGPYTELESQLPEIHNDYIRALKYGRALRSGA